jgi:type I restriction enzyme S subunit
MSEKAPLQNAEQTLETAQPKRYAAYPAYQSSGIDWLGDIPEHWPLVPLKHRTKFINGMAFKPDEWSTEGVPIIRIVNLNRGEDFNYFEGSVDDRYHVKEGDLLFGWSGNRGTSFGPFLWWRSGLHYLNQHIFKLTDYRDAKSWFYWALKAVTGYIEEEAHGIIGMVHVTKGRLGAVKIPVPPLDEQQAIARFLDEQTKKIDDLIEAKRDLLALLKEKRQAVITHAVTKGLNPDATLKPSGVDWLGDVPEHWDVKRLKFLSRVNPSSSELASIRDDEDVSFVPMDAVYEYGGLRLDTVRPLEEVKSGFTYFRDGDVVVAKITPCFENGKGSMAVGLTNGLAFGTTELHVVRSSPLLDNTFLFYLTISDVFRKLGAAEMYGAGGQKRVPTDFIRDFPVAFPDIDEQQAIACFLDEQTKKIEEVTQETTAAIDRLTEYRTALISAAVTGKIDVRGGMA